MTKLPDYNRLEYRFVSADHLDALYATMRKQEEAIKVMREALDSIHKRVIYDRDSFFGNCAMDALIQADKILREEL